MSDALDRGLEEMRSRRRPGLVIVIPDDSPYLLGTLSDRLSSLFVEAAPGSTRAVFVCARSSEARKRFGEAPTLLALDPDGRPIGSRTGELGELLEVGAFGEAVDALFSAYPAAPAPPALPYGVEWAEDTHRNLFGTAYDPCPPCGMPRVGPNEAELIRYLRLME
jgi:hypothetical protein